MKKLSGSLGESVRYLAKRRASAPPLPPPMCQLTFPTRPPIPPTPSQLKDIFRDIEQENFEHVYQLFSDAFKQQKRVDPKEFVLTMSLLACPITDKSTECVLIFTIFDPDGSGTLDREEFSRLMKATIMSKLTHVEFLMKNDKAKQLMEKHMASEYTEENGQFYTTVVEWKKHEFPTLEMTEEIVNKFVRVGSELQVNISSR